VLFRTAVSQMLADMPNTAHLEIGPHSALAGPLRHIYKETNHTAPYTSLAERGEDASHTFLAAIGNLYCFGITLCRTCPSTPGIMETPTGPKPV